jgi:predicted nucleic-acid-binding protein
VKSIDTNIALRFLLNDDPLQSPKAKQVLSNPPIYISDVVFTETVYVLEKTLSFDRKDVTALVRLLLAIPGLVFNDHLLPDVIDLFESKRGLSFVDCYAATEASIFNTTLLTFDRKLAKQGGGNVMAP